MRTNVCAPTRSPLGDTNIDRPAKPDVDDSLTTQLGAVMAQGFGAT